MPDPHKAPTTPEGWTEVPLGQVGDVVFSNVDKKSRFSEPPVSLCNYLDVYQNDYLGDDHRYMKATASHAEIRKFGLRPGDVLITKDSETPDDIGIPAVIDSVVGTLVCGYHLALIRPGVNVNPVFLAKQIGHERIQRYFGREAHGITRYGLSTASVIGLPLWLPPIREQDWIAVVLRTLGDAIQRAEEVIVKLQQIKQGLLHDLLTRGVSEHGEVRPVPDEAPHHYKDSALGRIPKKWEARRLEEISENFDGQRIPLKQSDRSKRHGPFPYYGASGIIDFIDDYLFEGDHVLLGEDGENVESRRLPLAFKVSGKFWVNNHAHVYRASSGMDLDFLCELLEATDYSRIVSGSAQPKLTQEGLRQLLFATPPLHEQRLIVRVLLQHNHRLEAERAYVAKLRTLKHGVSGDLLNGKVRAQLPVEVSA